MASCLSNTRICLVPKLEGLGGMVTFQEKLVNGLTQRGFLVCYNLEDAGIAAILVIGGTRQIGALLRAKRRGVRIVQRLDGMNWLQRKQKTSAKKFLRAEGNNWVLAFIRRFLAEKIVYQSQFSQRWWNEVHGKLGLPSQVIYNGVDLQRYSPDGPHHRPVDSFQVLLVEGHLGSENAQGLMSAIGLVDILNRQYDLPAHLVVVGDIEAALKKGLQSSVNESRVTWLGVVPRPQIPEIDRSAHVLFSADLNAACPNVVVEALACGLPVVSFDTGALSELVTQGAGRVVGYGSNYWNLEPPFLPPLAEATREILLSNDGFRKAARQRAETAFGIDSMVDSYLKVLLG